MANPVNQTRQAPLFQGIPALVFVSAAIPWSLCGATTAIFGGMCDHREDGLYFLQNHGRVFAVSAGTWWTQLIAERTALVGAGVLVLTGLLLIVLNATRPAWYVNAPQYRKATVVLFAVFATPFVVMLCGTLFFGIADLIEWQTRSR